MAEIATATASAALASGIAAGTSGLPPQEVILWSLAGGVASVWLSREADAFMTTGLQCKDSSLTATNTHR